MVKICIECGEEFTTNNSKKITCSKLCKGRHDRKKLIGIFKVCPMCGKRFELMQGNKKQVYCCIECKNKSNIKDIVRKCECCGKEFQAKPHSKKKFCSNECVQNNKKNTIEMICEQCGKVFLRNKAQEGRAKYCSRECHNEAQKKTIITHCSYCGKELIRNTSTFNKAENHFCDLQCLGKWNGERNKSRITKVCEICGDEFEVVPSRDTAVTCSVKCQNKWQSIHRSGENATNWQGGGGIIKCLNCGKEFYVGKYSYEHEIAKHCSIECKQEYWSNNVITTDDFREKHRLGNLQMLSTIGNRETSIERKIREYLEQNNINHNCQHIINDKFCVDFYLPDHNIIIEAFGDYWHSNPLKYGEDKIPLNNMQQKNIKKDKARIAYLTKCDYSLFILWETDINSNLEETMKLIKEICIRPLETDISTTERLNIQSELAL